MGAIRRRSDKRPALLAECTLLGRAATCDIRVRSAEVSAEHAALRWTERRWWIVDLNSRNGTWVDGHRLQHGEPVALQLGGVVTLGPGSEAFVLNEDGPPEPFVRSPEGDLLAEGTMLALPSDDDPQIVIMRSSDGAWIVEDSGGVRPAEDREILRANGHRYRIYLPNRLPSTAAAGVLLSVEDSELHVRHDGTEEHVVVDLEPRSGRCVSLGHRAHNVILLELARARLADRDRGIVAAEEGWVHREDLCKRLNLPVNHVNIMVHRLRRQLEEMGMVDAAAIVERRARSGLMRVGTAAVSVRRLER